MLRTRVGYAGGSTPHPTYHDIGDHSESVELTYDPALLPYERLLELFWEGHDPTAPAWSRQYASILFYHDEAQRLLAEKSKAEQERRRGAPIRTEILPAGRFTQAEDYHQKYYYQNDAALRRAAAPLLSDPRELVGSTLAARLNAAAAGQLSPGELEQDLSLLSIEGKQQEALLDALPASR